MKRSTLFKYFVLTLSIVALAGVAQAGNMAVSKSDAIVSPDEYVTVASQLITASGGPLIDLVGTGGSTTFDLRKILYTPSIDLPTLSTIKFAFSNGGVQKTASNNYYLRVVGKTDSAPSDTWQVATLVDFTTVSINSVDYYSTMTFRVVDHKEGGATIDRITANAVVVMTEDAGAENPPTVKMDASGSDLTVNIPLVKDETGTEKQAPLVTAQHIIAHVIPGLSASLQSVTSQIDVNPAAPNNPRTVFVTGTGTTLTTSTGRVTVTSSADVGFALGASDLFTVTVSRGDNTGVSSIGLGTLDDPSGSLVGTKYVYTLTSNFASIPLTTGQDAKITVTGSTPLQTGDWLMTLWVDPTSSWGVDPAAQTLIDGSVSHSWTINGSQFAVPSLHTKTGLYGTDILITNKSDLAAGVNFEIRSETGLGKAVTLTCPSPYNSVPANSALLIPGYAIQSAVLSAFPSMTNAGNGVRYSAFFTVNAAQDQVFATAYQKDSNGVKRTIPLFKPTTNDVSWKE